VSKLSTSITLQGLNRLASLSSIELARSMGYMHANVVAIDKIFAKLLAVKVLYRMADAV